MMIKSKTDFVLLMILCMVEFFAFFSFSMIAPFYPIEAKERYHVSSSIQGLVFAIHPLIVFILSPYVGKVISTPGRTKPCILIGTLCMVVGNALFAFVNQFQSKYAFLVLSFVARIIIAVGTSLANTASLAFLTERFKSDLSAVFGITELFVGVGFMAGPSVGGVLYAHGGFWLPFTVVGSLNLLNLIVLWIFVPAVVHDRVNVNVSDTGISKKKEVTVKDSLKIPAVWVVCLTIHTIGFIVTFIQPILSFHLQTITHHHISIERIGLVFFLFPAVYAFLAPILGIFVDKWFNPRNLLIIGHFMVALCYFFMGPSPFLRSILHPSVTVTSIALALLGVAQCPIMVPVISDLQMAIVNAGYPSSQQTSSIVSGLFTSAINLGQVTGPSLAGFLQGYFEFPWSSTIVAVLVFAEGILVFAFTVWERRTWKICCVPFKGIPIEKEESEPLLKGVSREDTSVAEVYVTYDSGCSSKMESCRT